jgi:amidase
MGVEPHQADTATGLAADVRAGRRNAIDVAEDYLHRIAALDPPLNAFAHVRREAAMADARAVDAHPGRAHLTLAGVPVAIKDNMAVTGSPVRYGSAATPDAPATADDELVVRLRAAGAVIVGTTRMCELAIWGFTSSAAFGPTRSPLDPSRDPGGSSGGAAAAVAAGMAVLGVGTDGGGSIRIPAAYCGLVGLKPSRGAVPLPGGLAEHWHGLTVAGPLARTVADARLLFEVLGGSAAGSAGTPVRIVHTLQSPSPIGRAGPNQKRAVAMARERLANAGHEVTLTKARYSMTMMQDWTRLWCSGIAEEADRLELDLDRLEPRTARVVRKGRRVRRMASRWPDRADAWAGNWDVLITPVTAKDPQPAGAYDGNGYLRTYLGAARNVPLTPAWNLAGFPALAVPVGTDGSIPMAVQLIGPPGSEGVLLDLAEIVSQGS